MIAPIQKEHALQVAKLHIQGISTGFISSLGEKFVTVLYESIADSPYGFGFVDQDGDRVAGFVVLATNLNGLYKQILKKNFFYFTFLLFGKIFSLKTIRRIYETLFYPNRAEKHDLPNAELLSVAVAETERGKGIAKALIQKGLQECRKKGILKVKVLVADFNEPANKLYQKIGFKRAAQIENHGIISNVYVVPTDHFEKND